MMREKEIVVKRRNDMHQDDFFLRDCVEWDIVNWSKALVFWDKSIDLNNKNFSCLELGGRRGGLSLWLAGKGNDVICSDYENPHNRASKVHSKYAFQDRISYQAIDATDIPYENHFDIIAFKSILGGISRNGQKHLVDVVLGQILRALKPGGTLLFAENLVASALHQFLRKKMTGWGSYWNYLDLDDVEDLFSHFDALQYDTAGFLGAFGQREYQRRILGKIDTLVCDRLLHNKMKYIIFGVAKKPL